MPVRFDSGRIEAFNGGVFGIAATLLVLEIAVPEASFDGASFWTIGGLWVLHHSIFRRLRYADLHLIRMNLFLLFVVAFLPFPTKLMAEAIESPSSERVAVLFYAATLLVISVTVTMIGRYAAGRDALLGEGVERSEMHAIAALGQPSLASNGLLLALAIFVPQIAAIGLFVVSLFVGSCPRARSAGFGVPRRLSGHVARSSPASGIGRLRDLLFGRH